MPNIGMGELLVLLAILMLVFGAARLPQIGEGIGKAVRNLKRGLNTDDDIDVTPQKKQVSAKSSGKKLEEEEEESVSEAEVVER